MVTWQFLCENDFHVQNIRTCLWKGLYWIPPFFGAKGSILLDRCYPTELTVPVKKWEERLGKLKVLMVVFLKSCFACKKNMFLLAKNVFAFVFHGCPFWIFWILLMCSPNHRCSLKGTTSPPENQCQERLSSSFLPHTHGYPGIVGGIFQVSEQDSPLDQPLLLPNSGSHDDLGLGFPTKNETFLVPVDPKNVSNPGSSNWAATNLWSPRLSRRLVYLPASFAAPFDVWWSHCQSGSGACEFIAEVLNMPLAKEPAFSETNGCHILE